MQDARETALLALTAGHRGAWSDLSLKNAIRKAGLDRRDAALCSAICYGVLQNRALFDFYIGSYSSLRLGKISPAVLEILRCGVCQLVAMDRVPPSAAVNSAVALTKKYANPVAAGFVNAVLRKIAANAQNLPEVPRDGAEDYLSVRYSHPKWIVSYLIKKFGEQEAEALLRENNTAPPLCARLNTLAGEPDALSQALCAQGVEVERHPFLPEAAYLRGTGDLTALPSFEDGLFAVQDAASQLCVRALDPRPGDQLIDVCGAPGGKTFAAAAHMENRGRILCCDIHQHKLALVGKDARRLRVEIAEPTLADAAVFTPAWESAFDRVLADVPCSGLGIIRKKPDIRYKDPAAVAALPRVQRRILENTGRYLKNGGVMIYSTCTILTEENEDVVRAFLEQHPEFAPEPFRLPGELDAPEGMLTLLPTRHGTDGFFIARLRKKDGAGR